MKLSHIILPTLIGLMPIGAAYAAPATPGGADPAGLFSIYFQNVAKSLCTGSSVIQSMNPTKDANYLSPICIDVHNIIDDYISVPGNGQITIGTTTYQTSQWKNDGSSIYYDQGEVHVKNGHNLVLIGGGVDAGDIIFKDDAGNQKARIYSDPSSQNGLMLSVKPNNFPSVYISPGGSVGIGVTDPDPGHGLDIGTNLRVRGDSYLKGNTYIGTPAASYLTSQNDFITLITTKPFDSTTPNTALVTKEYVDSKLGGAGGSYVYHKTESPDYGEQWTTDYYFPVGGSCTGFDCPSGLLTNLSSDIGTVKRVTIRITDRQAFDWPDIGTTYVFSNTAGPGVYAFSPSLNLVFTNGGGRRRNDLFFSVDPSTGTLTYRFEDWSAGEGGVKFDYLVEYN